MQLATLMVPLTQESGHYAEALPPCGGLGNKKKRELHCKFPANLIVTNVLNPLWTKLFYRSNYMGFFYRLNDNEVHNDSKEIDDGRTVNQ